MPIPELCVEVLSSNGVYDRLTKRFVYAEAGVQGAVDRGAVGRRVTLVGYRAEPE